MARISLSSAKHKSITGISSSRASNNYNNYWQYNYLAIDCRMPIVSPMEESWGSECPCPMPVLTSNSRPASPSFNIYCSNTRCPYHRSCNNEPSTEASFKSQSPQGRVRGHCPVNICVNKCCTRPNVCKCVREKK